MLGRPLQAFSQLAAQIGQAIVLHLQQQGHRPIAIDIRGTQITPQAHAGDALCIDLPRTAVLAHMHARYGFQGKKEEEKSSAPVSTTETRIRAALMEAIRTAISSALPSSSTTPHHVQCWEWKGFLHIGDSAPTLLTITMDRATSHLVSVHVSKAQKPAIPPGKPSAPMAPLPIQLVAQLAEKNITAADVQALQPGAVLPIALERTIVLLNDTPMLSACVAEHQGKLHLTAFETLE